MAKRFLSLTVALFLMVLVKAQIANNTDLFRALKQQDSIFFERSFNRCDLDYLNQAIDQDLVFYHDKSGIQDKAIFLNNVTKYICGDTIKKPIRKVEAESLEVFPLYNNGVLYGAIQTGVHHFYKRVKNKPDVHTNTAKFTHLYLLKDGKWLLKEVLSFDHQEPTIAKTDSSFEQAIEKLLVQEKVPALGLGVIENGTLKRIQVFGNIDKGVPAAYNTIFKVASLTKPVTALVALRLINAGKLGLDEPLEKYWKDPDIITDARIKKLTPRIILSHQTGFTNWRYLNPSNKLAFQFEPGTKFQYSGEGFEYLRRALEAKFGKPLEALADEWVFKPAGMKDTHFWWDKTVDEKRYAKNYDTAGNAIATAKYYKANAAANLLTTVEDYGNFLTYILNGAGLSQQLLNEMHSNQVQLKADDYFGLGWEKLTGFSGNEYALIHTGKDPGVNTLAIMFPKSKRGYLVFLNGDNAGKVFEELLTKYLYLGKELWTRK
jgi:CubicO group peptidase (beta-lactamase class C family)